MESRLNTKDPGPVTLYGLRNCDSCRKALRWLEAEHVDHRFHDLRADGLERAMVERWLASPLAARLVNRRSTTWRQLSDAQRAADGAALVELLLAHPTLVKRPVFERGGEVLALGFDPDSLRTQL